METTEKFIPKSNNEPKTQYRVNIEPEFETPFDIVPYQVMGCFILTKRIVLK